MASFERKELESDPDLAAKRKADTQRLEEAKHLCYAWRDYLNETLTTAPTNRSLGFRNRTLATCPTCSVAYQHRVRKRSRKKHLSHVINTPFSLTLFIGDRLLFSLTPVAMSRNAVCGILSSGCRRA
jgi:hypothetical protein